MNDLDRADNLLRFLDQIAEVWIEISEHRRAYVKMILVTGKKMDRDAPAQEARLFGLKLGETGLFNWQLIDWIYTPVAARLASLGFAAEPVKRLVFWRKGQPPPWGGPIVPSDHWLTEGTKVMYEETPPMEKRVVKIEGRLTSSFPASRFWTLTCEDGTRVNVFQHNGSRNGLKKDQTPMFMQAGYDLTMIEVNEKQFWRKHPIIIQVVPDGEKYFKTIGVAGRGDTRPDEPFVPDTIWGWHYAKQRAELFFELPNIIVLDCETVSAEYDSEIISIALYAASRRSMQVSVVDAFKTLIKPGDEGMAHVLDAVDVHGITPADLQTAPTFKEVYPRLMNWLDGANWCIYNAPFDSGMIFMNCAMHLLRPPSPQSITDAMTLFAEYYGEFNTAQVRFNNKSLIQACASLGVSLSEDEAHDAGNDALATLRLVEAMASGVEPSHIPDGPQK